MMILTAVSAVLLALVNTLGGRIEVLNRVPRRVLLSLAGGASVAYIFLHILPWLSIGQSILEESGLFSMRYIETHIYILGLIGLTIFYGLERSAKMSRKRNRKTHQMDCTTHGVFWFHTICYAGYYFLIGYLLVHREKPGLISLLLFVSAMALHFFVNDYSLWSDHKDAYRRYGRWILSSEVLAGWAVGTLTEIPQVAVAGLFAFLAGGILLNVLKEELPEERQSNFRAFAIGAGVYGLLLIVV
jgi:hypothetical protein